MILLRDRDGRMAMFVMWTETLVEDERGYQRVSRRNQTWLAEKWRSEVWHQHLVTLSP